MTMQDLIERLEKLTAPDRELGREVLIACGWRKTCTGYFLGALFHWSSPDGKFSFDGDKFYRYDPTASMDIAVMLVPEGMYWHAGHGKTRDDEPLGGAAIIEPSGLKTLSEAEAPTAAIALCIAALKARASLNPQQQNT